MKRGLPFWYGIVGICFIVAFPIWVIYRLNEVRNDGIAASQGQFTLLLRASSAASIDLDWQRAWHPFITEPGKVRAIAVVDSRGSTDWLWSAHPRYITGEGQPKLSFNRFTEIRFTESLIVAGDAPFSVSALYVVLSNDDISRILRLSLAPMIAFVLVTLGIVIAYLVRGKDYPSPPESP